MARKTCKERLLNLPDQESVLLYLTFAIEIRLWVADEFRLAGTCNERDASTAFGT